MFTFYSCKDHHTPIAYSHYLGDHELQERCKDLVDAGYGAPVYCVDEEGAIVTSSRSYRVKLDEHGAPFHPDI